VEVVECEARVLPRDEAGFGLDLAAGIEEIERLFGLDLYAAFTAF
jgi:hypothetical protein